jgi:hypothetical protein
VTVDDNGILGNARNQFYNPYGDYIDLNNVIYLADYYNYRVQQ